VDLYRLMRTLPTPSLQRGQFQISQQDLCARWQWSRFRVRAFLQARIDEGLLVLVRGATGQEAPVWAIAALHHSQVNLPKSSQVESAPVVGFKPVGSQVTGPLDFKEKESTKEKETGLERDSKERVSEDTYRPEQNAPENVTAISFPVFQSPQQTGASSDPEREALAEKRFFGFVLDPEQRPLAQKWFSGCVPRQQIALGRPLTKRQVFNLESAMDARLIPWPLPGSVLAVMMGRPV